MLSRRIFTHALLASSVMAVLLMSGCGEQHPKSPLGAKLEPSSSSTSLSKKSSGPASGTISTSETRVERDGTMSMALMDAGELSYSQFVPASTGGTLSFGEFQFYIPPGSLNNDTVISIAKTSDRYIQMDFGPDGTQFDPPATMTVSYASANLRNVPPSNLSISWFDVAANKWVNIGGTVNQAAMTVSVSISHFTQYSLSTR